MPICNIVDRRTNSFKVEVMVIFEDRWHDNSVDGSSKFEELGVNLKKGVDYLGIRRTTIELAIQYAAQEWKQPVTLFLYDLNINNSIDYDHIKEQGGEFILIK